MMIKIWSLLSKNSHYIRKGRQMGNLLYFTNELRTYQIGLHANLPLLIITEFTPTHHIYILNFFIYFIHIFNKYF